MPAAAFEASKASALAIVRQCLKEAAHVLALCTTALRDILEIEARQCCVHGARVQLVACLREPGTAGLVDGDHHGQHQRIAADGVAFGVDQLLDVRPQLARGALAEAILDDL